MKFDKEQIKSLAKTMKIPVSDVEVDEISNSILELTEKLDNLLAVEVEQDPKYSSSENTNIFMQDTDSEVDSDFLDELENFDGEYFHVKKVIVDEE